MTDTPSHRIATPIRDADPCVIEMPAEEAGKKPRIPSSSADDLAAPADQAAD